MELARVHVTRQNIANTK